MPNIAGNFASLPTPDRSLPGGFFAFCRSRSFLGFLLFPLFVCRRLRRGKGKSTLSTRTQTMTQPHPISRMGLYAFIVFFRFGAGHQNLRRHNQRAGGTGCLPTIHFALFRPAINRKFLFQRRGPFPRNVSRTKMGPDVDSRQAPQGSQFFFFPGMIGFCTQFPQRLV